MNNTLAFPNPNNEQVFTGTFAVSNTFPTGTTVVPVRVYAGTTDINGNVNQGFIAERKLHVGVTNVTVSDPGNTDGTLDRSDGNGPFHRVKLFSPTDHLNGLDCTRDLPLTNPETCNIVSDVLSKDSAYVYIRGVAGTCNIEFGFQLGHSNNAGWKLPLQSLRVHECRDRLAGRLHILHPHHRAVRQEE